VIKNFLQRRTVQRRDSKLFFEFSLECALYVFAPFHLAPREFPQSTLMAVRVTPGD
jgi:hypothetical protein